MTATAAAPFTLRDYFPYGITENPRLNELAPRLREACRAAGVMDLDGDGYGPAALSLHYHLARASVATSRHVAAERLGLALALTLTLAECQRPGSFGTFALGVGLNSAPHLRETPALGMVAVHSAQVHLANCTLIHAGTPQHSPEASARLFESLLHLLWDVVAALHSLGYQPFTALVNADLRCMILPERP